MSERPVKLPSTLLLGGLPWTLTHGQLTNAAGVCDNATRTITIQPGQDKLCEADTVLHELTHAILRSQGRPYEGSTEERYAWAFAAGLLSALRANPALVTYLTRISK